MRNTYLPVSDHRFKKSPFFACNDRPDTRYGIYNGRLYPVSSGVDIRGHYETLRTQCCLYDVPETPLRITGKDAEALLEKLFTRTISNIKIGRAGYAIACNHDGGVIMDGVLLRPNAEEFIYVQANGDFLNWAAAHNQCYEATIEDFDSWVLQVQGPTSLQVLQGVAGISETELTYYGVVETEIVGQPFIISRSGWTGERGFEIYSRGSNFDGTALWSELLRVGEPAGLIASDVSSMHVRRIEAGILDYGTDIDQTLNPYQIGLGRLVHLQKRDFVGKSALQSTNHKDLLLTGIRAERYTPERQNLLYRPDGQVAGWVTAGAYSYSLNCGIGFARLSQPLDVGTELLIGTERDKAPCKITELPFLDPERRLVR